MFTHLITTLWGIPTVGMAASSQALPDSVLEFAKETPQDGKMPAGDWFGALGSSFRRTPESSISRVVWTPAFAGVTFFKVSFACPKPSAGWSLPVAVEIAKPPSGSGKIRPINPKESAEEYVATSLSLLLERVVHDKKYGFSESDADKMIGDLWFILNQLTATGKGTKFFWIWILNELMWGDILESPSNKDVAGAIVGRFLPWMDRLVSNNLALQKIVAAVLEKPLVTKGRHSLLVCYRHLFDSVPSLVNDPHFARAVLVKTAHLALIDPDLDI